MVWISASYKIDVDGYTIKSLKASQMAIVMILINSDRIKLVIELGEFSIWLFVKRVDWQTAALWPYCTQSGVLAILSPIWLESWLVINSNYSISSLWVWDQPWPCTTQVQIFCLQLSGAITQALLICQPARQVWLKKSEIIFRALKLKT